MSPSRHLITITEDALRRAVHAATWEYVREYHRLPVRSESFRQIEVLARRCGMSTRAGGNRGQRSAASRSRQVVTSVRETRRRYADIQLHNLEKEAAAARIRRDSADRALRPLAEQRLQDIAVGRYVESSAYRAAVAESRSAHEAVQRAEARLRESQVSTRVEVPHTTAAERARIRPDGYYIRFVNETSHARADLSRGYSFSGYQFFHSREEAERDAEGYGWTREDVAPIRRNGTVMWGYALGGLAGFGPYDSVEEALADARRRGGYNGVPWPRVAVYSGRHKGQADAQDGDLFEPKELIRIESLTMRH